MLFHRLSDLFDLIAEGQHDGTLPKLSIPAPFRTLSAKRRGQQGDLHARAQALRCRGSQSDGFDGLVARMSHDSHPQNRPEARCSTPGCVSERIRGIWQTAAAGCAWSRYSLSAVANAGRKKPSAQRPPAHGTLKRALAVIAARSRGKPADLPSTTLSGFTRFIARLMLGAPGRPDADGHQLIVRPS